jgi:hypothetical protein
LKKKPVYLRFFLRYLSRRKVKKSFILSRRNKLTISVVFKPHRVIWFRAFHSYRLFSSTFVAFIFACSSHYTRFLKSLIHFLHTYRGLCKKTFSDTNLNHPTPFLSNPSKTDVNINEVDVLKIFLSYTTHIRKNKLIDYTFPNKKRESVANKSSISIKISSIIRACLLTEK